MQPYLLNRTVFLAALSVALLAGCSQGSSAPAKPISPPGTIGTFSPDMAQRLQVDQKRDAPTKEQVEAHAKAREIRKERFEAELAPLLQKGVIVKFSSKEELSALVSSKGSKLTTKYPFQECKRKPCYFVSGEVPSGHFTQRFPGFNVFTLNGKALPGNPLSVVSVSLVD